jgi:hypothetical protein
MIQGRGNRPEGWLRRCGTGTGSGRRGARAGSQACSLSSRASALCVAQGSRARRLLRRQPRPRRTAREALPPPGLRPHAARQRNRGAHCPGHLGQGGRSPARRQRHDHCRGEPTPLPDGQLPLRAQGGEPPEKLPDVRRRLGWRFSIDGSRRTCRRQHERSLTLRQRQPRDRKWASGRARPAALRGSFRLPA